MDTEDLLNRDNESFLQDSEETVENELAKDESLVENEDNLPLNSNIHSEDLESKVSTTQAQKTEVHKYTKLPLSRIKSIMKLDPDVGLANSDAVFLVTKATELFLETIAKEAYSYTSRNKKKTVTKKDLDTVINTVDCLCFLEGALDWS